jgi:hypothetical protein
MKKSHVKINGLKLKKLKYYFYYYYEKLSIFYICYFYFEHGLSKKLNLFCYRFMSKYIKMIFLKLFIEKEWIIDGNNNNYINDIFNIFIFSIL